MDSPFPGLRSYRVDEADWFFGREGTSDAMALKLTQHRFLAVIGESGCGKSSLVRAGLLPTLQAGLLAEAGSRWRVVDLHPGSDPIGALSRALGKAGLTNGTDREKLECDPGAIAAAWGLNPAGGNPLVLVDQFEELFFSKAHRDAKAAFLGLLLDAAGQTHSPVYVITTMRSDFLGLCSQFRGLPEAINQGQYLVPRMTRENLRLTIEGPARLAGAEMEPRLVQTLLNEVGTELDQLPVLQHVLLRTWNNWVARNDPDDPVREDPDYAKTGRMQDALSNHADEALKAAATSIGPGAAPLAQRIFTLLRDRDVNGQEVRRPTSVGEMAAVTGADLTQLRTLLEEFRQPGRTFLNASPDDWASDEAYLKVEYDVTHESFVRKWKSLRDVWIPAELNSRRMYARLARQALDSSPENPSYMDGAVLDQSLEWADPPEGSAGLKPTAAWAARYAADFGEPPPRGLFDRALAFLFASRDARERRRAEAQAAQNAVANAQIAEAQALLAKAIASRASAKKRLAYIASGLTLIGLFIVALLAWHATRQKNHASVLTIASSALLSSQDPWQAVTSALLAGESLRREPTLLAGGVLSTSLSLIPRPLPGPTHKDANLMSYDPSGGNFATVDGSGAVRVWDAAGKPVQTVQTNRKVTHFHLMRGQALIQSEEGGLEMLPLNGQPATSLCRTSAAFAISPNGEHVAALCDGKLVSAGFALDGNGNATLELPPDFQEADLLSVSNDGEWIAMGGSDTSVNLFSKRTKRISSPVNSGGQLAAFGFAGDHQLVLVRTDGTLRQWDPSDLTAATDDCHLEGFQSGDGFTTLLAGRQGNLVIQSDAQTIFAWSITGEQLAVANSPDTLSSVAASESEIAGVSGGGQVRRWALPRLVEPPMNAQTTFFSPDGKWFVERRVLNYRLASTSDRLSERVKGAETGFYPLAFDPEGKRVAVRVNQAVKPEPRLFSGLEIRAFENDKIGAQSLIPPIRELGTLFSTMFSPDGSKLAARASSPGRVRLRVWDSHTGRLIGEWPMKGRAARARAIFFSPDSQKLLWDDGLTTTAWDPSKSETAKVDLGVSERHGPWAITSKGVSACALFPAQSAGEPDTEDAGQAVTREKERQTIALWRHPSWKSPVRLDTTGPITSMLFSQDGSLLISVTLDGTIQVWDWRQGVQLANIATHNAISAMTYGDDHRIVVREAGRLKSYLWRLDDLFAGLCKSAQRQLTLAEWRSVQLEEQDFPRKPLCSPGGRVVPQ